MPTLINVAHLHLLLNHVPTVGTVIGIGLLLLAFVRRNDHLGHAGLEVFFLVALLTLPAYLTGVAAQSAVLGTPGVTEVVIDAHHDAALAAFVLMQMTGAVAWFALWQFRRRGTPAPWAVPSVLLLAVLTIAVMGRAATLGGEIRHLEIRAAEAGAMAATVPGFSWLTKASVQATVSGYPWVWPAAETVHFLGLCLVIGVLLPINLRLIGLMRAIPFPALHALLPWGLFGFGLNLVTGMTFFIHASQQYVNNDPFYWKTIFLMVTGANFLYLTVGAGAWSLRTGEAARPLDKAFAGASIALWLGIVYWGRMLPFIGNAF